MTENYQGRSSPAAGGDAAVPPRPALEEEEWK